MKSQNPHNTAQTLQKPAKNCKFVNKMSQTMHTYENFIIESRLRGVKDKKQLQRLYAAEFPDSITFDADYKAVLRTIDSYYNRDTIAGTAELVLHLWKLYEQAQEDGNIKEARMIIGQIHAYTIANPPAESTAKEVDIFARPGKRKTGG
jgi:hypothetical protein